jgi:hypothetical protein
MSDTSAAGAAPATAPAKPVHFVVVDAAGLITATAALDDPALEIPAGSTQYVCPPRPLGVKPDEAWPTVGMAWNDGTPGPGPTPPADAPAPAPSA